ncbi:hypothetical protein IWQ62_002459 [Dispira parvispora]|uniref:alpha-1,2-Mannosidase n=1 Tax=Dispira parvispora TaxID=1520584 RepID=A0A9W8E3U6_9FUNG|nr:hypothetical protein IWQ62_002459 [Dispira parvispora]
MVNYGKWCLAICIIGWFTLPCTQAAVNTTTLNYMRRQAVRRVTQRAWQAYITHARGFDELRPVGCEGVDNFGGLRIMAIDSLDTLWMMGLENEFWEAVELARGVNFTQVDGDLSFFETGIRVLGGLISAYELSQVQVLKDRAVEIGDVLLRAFDTPTGLPNSRVNPRRNQALGTDVVLAEVGTIQLEMAKLSQITGNPVYNEKAQEVITFINSLETYLPGLVPVFIDANTGEFRGDLVTFGALGDSYYEYLIKYAAMTRNTKGIHSQMYQQAIDSMGLYMLTTAKNHPDDWYLPELHRDTIRPTMQHLTCFAPGMLALGSDILNRPADLGVAKQLLKSCINFYQHTATGLGPEEIGFDPSDPTTDGTSKQAFQSCTTKPLTKDQESWQRKHGYYVKSPSYILRPETIESLLYLYRYTGNVSYQAMGWRFFESIEHHTRTSVAYSSIHDVNARSRSENLSDSMPSFFLAETLKYLYLLFSDKSVFSFRDYVFNTEAHPFKIM